MERVLVDSSWQLRLELVDQDGDHLSPGAVTAQIIDAAGAEITGSPFTANQDSETQLWAVTLTPSHTATLGLHRVTWTAGAEIRTSEFEIVGGFLFSLGQLRKADEQLEDTERYPGAMLRAARDAVEDVFETRCRPSFRPRGARATADLIGTQALILPDLHPRSLVSLSIDDTALTAGELDAVELHEAGLLLRDVGWPAGADIDVVYEHGLDSPPGPVRDAAIKLTKDALLGSPVPDRATSQSTEEGTYRFSIAGADGPTGIPDVDVVLDLYSRETAVA